MTDDPKNESPEPDEVAGLRNEAQRELVYLAGHWQERLDEFDVTQGGDATEQRSLLGDALLRFRMNKIAMVGFLVIALYILLAIFGPSLNDASPRRIDYSIANQGPSAEHWFGTDPQGRDIWQRVWLGARVSLSIAAVASLVILAIGLVYGSISGYVGGRTDNAMMRFLDALYGLPYLPFAIITATIMKEYVPNTSPLLYMVPALTLTSWFTAARIMRGQMLSLKTNDYVESALAQGAKSIRVMRRHILPNAAGVMVIAMFLEIPTAILGEAFLSFLGLGVRPPATSWGLMAEQGYKAIDVQPWLMWIPSLLIATTVLAAVAVADGVRDALDPRGQVH